MKNCTINNITAINRI